MKDILEIKNVAKKYQAKNGEIEAIKNVSFSVKNSEFVSIIRAKWMRKIHITFYYSRTRR